MSIKTTGSQSLVRCVALLLAAFLHGCGGGSGASDPPASSSGPAVAGQCASGVVARWSLDSAARAGRNTELALLSCGGELSQLRWAQSAGPALEALSSRSQALTLEPAAAGSYRYTVSFVDAQGRSQSGSIELPVAAAGDAGLVLRGEPSVLAGGSLSLRAWAPSWGSAERDQATVRWSVVDGPSADLGGASGWRLVFTAPRPAADSLLRLRATASLPDGRVLSGQFSLLVQAAAAVPANALWTASNPVSRTYAYKADGPYAQALADCVYNARTTTSPNTICDLNRLPLLGQMTAGAPPTVEQVMQRVLVSNDWMGEVFERFLREQDEFGDYRRMLASVTAVVIGGRVRPAFYWSATGAIYIDASYLWLTATQRDTLSEAPDPRSANGQGLGYAMPWRYVRNNTHASTSHVVGERQSRDITEIRYELGRLLYHELTHAADFLPPRVHAQLNGSQRVYQASPALTASQDLFQRLPFYSREMQGLADVLSFGASPTALQLSYRPDDIARFFAPDRVNDDYSYSVASGASFSREDAAMLVEEALMQRRYGVFRDVAVTDALAPGSSSADLLVRWGQRGRIGEAAIRPRLGLVLSEVMPWLGAGFADGLAAPQALRAGQTWGANLDLSGGFAKPLSAQQRYNEQAQTTRELQQRSRATQQR